MWQRRDGYCLCCGIKSDKPFCDTCLAGEVIPVDAPLEELCSLAMAIFGMDQLEWLVGHMLENDIAASFYQDSMRGVEGPRLERMIL